MRTACNILFEGQKAGDESRDWNDLKGRGRIDCCRGRNYGRNSHLRGILDNCNHGSSYNHNYTDMAKDGIPKGEKEWQ